MEKETRENFKKIEEIVKSSNNILLAGHIRPDGDSLGSLLAFAYALKDRFPDKKVVSYSKDPVPHSLSVLHGTSGLTDEIKEKPDLIIGFDYGDFVRLALPEEKIQGVKIITFDHHPESGQKGEIKIIETEMSSTAELVYEFFKEVGWEVSKNTANNILTGIITDTGGFARASSDTLKNAGELVDKGAPLEFIYQKSFSYKNVHAMQVWGEILKNSTMNPKHNFVATFISYKKYKEYGIDVDELKGVVSALRSAEDIKFALFAIEYESGKIKGSLRSDKFKDFDVSQIAKELGGGGHKYAAAFEYEGSIEDLEKTFLETVEQLAQ